MSAAITGPPISGIVPTASDTAVGAANADTVVTFPAVAGVAHTVAGVLFSYSGGTPAGTLRIESPAGTTVRQFDVTSAGPGPVPFAYPLVFPVSQAVVVTLTAGGSGTVGKLNVDHAAG